jgi:ATP/maltotriose-dependent transcriptional regulator MalT/DNA-binding SARP family transcriptional activator
MFVVYIRADKFYPPQVETPQFLFRERIIGELLSRCGSKKPTIVLEAQAGQGKTTFIKQFLNYLGVASAWYQVDAEDTDPAIFLVAIQTCLANLLEDCPSVANLRLLTGEGIALVDLPKRIDLLLDDIQSCLKKDLYVVFDDVHNLISHESSLFILNYLVEKAPSRLHFVLSSREPLHLEVWRAFPRKRNLIRISNRELALTDDEIADFSHQIFHLPVSHDDILKVSSNTDGWVMGIVLLGQQMSRRRDMSPPTGQGGVGRLDILEYFRENIFDTLELRLHRPLLMLSLLEEIPVALAETLTAEPEIGSDLGKLAQRNIFIRPLDPDSKVYGLHHLFRQFLREKAEDALSRDTIQRIYQDVGHFFFQRDSPSQALRYLLKAGDYDAIEAVLEKSGSAMLAANQTATLEAILSEIPEPDLARLGWAPFYLAMAHLDFAPARALPLLSKAMAVFSARHDELGELLCLARIISCQLTTSAGFSSEGEEMLNRAEYLFSRVLAELPPPGKILIIRSLAMGHCFFQADSETAIRDTRQALHLAREEQMVNFEAALLTIAGYIQILSGQWSQIGAWLEQAAAVVHCPDVGTFNSVNIHMMLLNFLYNAGDYKNYFTQKEQLVAAFGKTLFSQVLAGHSCFIWEMDIAICQGRFEDALGIATQVLYPPSSPHMRSQVLQLQSVALALHRQPGPALDASVESMQLREHSGGPYFVTMSKLMAGLTQGLCGNADQAVELLTEGIDSARRTANAYNEACGLMHRGRVHLDRADHERARQDIESGLSLMRRGGYRRLRAWTPQAVQAVLGFAVARGIETEFARDLAAELIDVSLREDSLVIPHIEFRVLGGFSIWRGGTLLLDAEALTPTQRELLCLLLASPGFKVAQETVQLHFWPDSSSATAFNTLISRLRKTLAEVFPEVTGHCYFNRDKGMIWLTHCRVDALEFLEAVNRGLEHSRLQEFWQAGNFFARAEALWGGEFAPGVTGEDRIRAFRDTLAKALAQMALTWCWQLAAANRLQWAVELAEKALRADPLNEALWALLYRLHGRRSAIHARQVLKRFAKLLTAEDYPEDEIAELIAGIVSASGPSFSSD